MAAQRVHHGHNIKRLREIQGMKQEALALELGSDWNQKKVSLLEAKEKIDEELMQQVAKVLKVPTEAIENFNEESVFNNIANTFNDNATLVNCQFNPIEKLIEAMEANKALYERLLQAEKEKNQLLERMLQERK